MGFSGHDIKCVVDHFGGFRTWIPERSDFLKGPKGPKGPLGPERSDFFKGPKGPKGPLGPERSDLFKGPKGPKSPLGPERSDFLKGGTYSILVDLLPQRAWVDLKPSLNIIDTGTKTSISRPNGYTVV